MSYKGLTIGVNKYTDSTFDPLDKVVTDVMAIGSILSSSRLGYEKKLQPIIGKDATVARIISELTDFFINCKHDDVLFLYWAGHGSASNDGCFIAYDTDYSCLSRTAILMEKVRELIENSPAKAIVSLFDCCYSGAVTRSDSDFRGLAERGLKVTGEGKVIITACTEFQKAYEMKSEPHGIFTYYLIAGLQGGAVDKNGNIPITALYQYIAEKMKNHNGIQQPVMHCKMTDPIIVATTNETVRDISHKEVIFKTRTDLLVEDSGQWCLIDGNPFEYNFIEDDGNTLNIEILNPASSQTVFLKKLTEPSPWGNGTEVHFVFNECCYMGTASVKNVVTNGRIVYKIIINKKQQQQRQMFSEMSVGLSGGATITPLQIATLRARRILLAEERNTQFSYSEWENLKMHIIGFSCDYRPLLEQLPIPEIILKCKNMDDDDWKIIRLFMVHYLLKTNTVDFISKLKLIISNDKLESIEFAGIRKNMYSNMQDDTISICDKYMG